MFLADLKIEREKVIEYTKPEDIINFSQRSYNVRLTCIPFKEIMIKA